MYVLGYQEYTAAYTTLPSVFEQVRRLRLRVRHANHSANRSSLLWTLAAASSGMLPSCSASQNTVSLLPTVLPRARCNDKSTAEYSLWTLERGDRGDGGGRHGVNGRHLGNVIEGVLLSSYLSMSQTSSDDNIIQMSTNYSVATVSQSPSSRPSCPGPDAMTREQLKSLLSSLPGAVEVASGSFLRGKM